MNLYLPQRYDERLYRLALGLELLDGWRRGRIAHLLAVMFDDLPQGYARPRVWRHNACLHVLLQGAGVQGPLALRVFDGAGPHWRAEHDRRRFVPRRLRIPLPDLALADSLPAAQRIRRPVLFPGAAYGVAESATGLRGRVARGGAPARWARVQALHPVSGATVGRAQCDDRGEFLLLLEAGAAPLGALTDPVAVNLRVYWANPPEPDPPDSIKAVDPLWDLPVEPLSAPGEPDAVAGAQLPWPGWTANAASTPMEFPLGRLLRQAPPLTD